DPLARPSPLRELDPDRAEPVVAAVDLDHPQRQPGANEVALVLGQVDRRRHQNVGSPVAPMFSKIDPVPSGSRSVANGLGTTAPPTRAPSEFAAWTPHLS